MEIKAFKSDEVKNNYMGNGSLMSEGLVVKFTIWKNDKFDTGFSLKFPSHKGKDDKWIDDAYLLSREVSNKVYGEVDKILKSSSTPAAENSNSW